MNIWCYTCKKYTKHIEVDSSKDKKNGWKVNAPQDYSSCRAIGQDYRTVQCVDCKRINTYDFAKD